MTRKKTARLDAAAGKVISNQEQADRAGPGIHRVAGVEGLYLKIALTGGGSWFWRYRFADRRRELGLGSRSRVKLAEAIGAAKDADTLRRRNIDPIDERDRVRAEIAAKAKAAKPVVFREAMKKYVDDRAPSWRHKYARSCWLAPVTKHVIPRLGHLSVDAIAIADVVAAVKAAEAAGHPKIGARLRMRIEQVLNFAIGQGWRSADKLNPASGKLVPTHQSKGERNHYRAVDLDDAQDVFRELKAQALASVNGALSAWVFMILTAARPSEALNAQWNEVDLVKRLWIVPAARMKAAREHRVPLSSEALAVLERQASIRSGDSVFPGRSGSPISYSAFATAPAKAGIAAAAPHGWRSVFRDYCGDEAEDVPRDLAEAALAHSLGPTEAAYRKRTAVEKRRAVMESYSAWLNATPTPKVVALDDHRPFPVSRKA